MVTTAPYGNWKSPLTEEKVTASSIRFGHVQTDGDIIYWLEGRPEESGRGVLVSANKDNIHQDLTPAPFSVGSRVHEYGGGDFHVANGHIWFVNSEDQDLYYRDLSGHISRLTKDPEYRFADMVFDARRDRLIAVAERHHAAFREPQNLIVSIACQTGEITPLIEGADFYMSPKISPKGDRLCWIEWYHPNLPWDETFLKIATFNDQGDVHDPAITLGGKGSSLQQPSWRSETTILFSDDATGWWNIYQFDIETKSQQNLTPKNAEYGAPAWVFGQSTYCALNETCIVASPIQNGESLLEVIYDTETKDISVSEPSSIHALQKSGETEISFLGGGPKTAETLFRYDIKTKSLRIVKESSSICIDKETISIPKNIEFKTTSNDTAYAFYYPPTNADFQAPDTAKPPLLVKCHGGPTGQTCSTFSPKIQYWTSRGFAVLDVNYRGSTGFGTDYRKKLHHKWGIFDVEDCVKGAEYLIQEGLVDPNKLAISGGSAGGFTVLCALTFHDLFQAGASYYGVADLKSLMAETHKFEAHYDDSLVGFEDVRDERYQERSPVHHADQLSCPVIFFQGLADKVVPPSQPEKMVQAMKEQKIPVSYVTFPTERHGFRQAETIQQTLRLEFEFYAQFFDYTPATTCPFLLEIENFTPKKTA